MNSQQLTSDLYEDEGNKLSVYQDSLGYWTIGPGILVDGRKGGGITAEESAYLLANRIASKSAELARAVPWYGRLDEVRQGALLNMSFQLGVVGLLGFKNSLGLIESGEYDRASVELKKSKWAVQTPDRADRVIKQIRTGKYRNATD